MYAAFNGTTYDGKPFRIPVVAEDTKTTETYTDQITNTVHQSLSVEAANPLQQQTI